MTTTDAIRAAFVQEHLGMRGVADVAGAEELLNALEYANSYELRQWARIICRAADRLDEKPKVID